MAGEADLFARLERLNEIGAALSSERDIDALLERILLAAKEITHADGGTLYRVPEGEDCLRFAIVRTASLGLAYGGVTGAPLGERFPDIPLHREDGAPNTAMVAAYAAVNAETVNIPDAYEAEGFDFSGTRRFDAHTGYRSRSFLTVPMKNHEGRVIGVLQLLNAQAPDFGAVRAFSLADQRLAESLASQAAVALTNRQLVQQLESLFESFIHLINLAIDEKSPYTGGHCQRVPVLTMMLAEAAHQTQVGPLAGFTLTEQDRYELRIAALLHDCGKITTPVHVVDKATKLQTLFDRIELIDTRFEVLRRDAEIAALEARLAGEDSASVMTSLHDTLAALDQEQAFLKGVNRGSERMSDGDREKVTKIGSSRRWRVGDGDWQSFLTENEVENLCIPAGTLTETERQVINHHIVATQRMLDALPWPAHLRHVPEYAGGHHERMDGKGYPKGLTRAEMSWQARMMGIADIFEALTAKDRPYKPGLSLSHALAIMDRFCANGHIDPDLYGVFREAGVWRAYAAQFLDAAQQDC